MAESNKRFGRLRRIPVRELWANEAGDFTPWLASQENISLLGDAIGVELEVEAQEKDVGPFRADILCRDTGTSEWVLIENQLERTDHSHLGQLITYAAGLNPHLRLKTETKNAGAACADDLPPRVVPLVIALRGGP